jgi:hypothetical protein
MSTRLGTHRTPTRPVRLDTRARASGAPPTVDQRIDQVFFSTCKWLDSHMQHIVELRKRIERIERGRR